MAFSIEYWVNFTDGKTRLREKSEKTVEAGRVLDFTYDPQVKIRQEYVQSSMKNCSYKVEVRKILPVI